LETVDMKKLTLELDHLRVESFDASPADPASRGSVQAHDLEESYPIWACKTPAGITQPATGCDTCTR
jgi:hypothetical protein